MDKDELISNQQLEIHELKKAITAKDISLHRIISSIISIGGPLNDNYHQYNSNQLAIFHRILEEAEEGKDFNPYESYYLG